MSKIAVFVDAGYFWVQTAHVLHGCKSNRDTVEIDYAALREQMLAQVADQFPSAELLRVYWYDGPSPQGHKTTTHLAIDELDDFKLRLGTRNGIGDQKAVDGLIIADLIGLAQSKAISGAVLLSGDADLTPGVIAGQGLGIRVHLLSMGPVNATSPYLRAEVDRKSHWADPTVRKFASVPVPRQIIGDAAVAGPAPTAPANACATEGMRERDPLEEAAVKTYQMLTAHGRKIELASGSLPRDVDGKLLWVAKEGLGRDLGESEKRTLRKIFKQKLS